MDKDFIEQTEAESKRLDYKRLLTLLYQNEQFVEDFEYEFINRYPNTPNEAIAQIAYTRVLDKLRGLIENNN